MKLKSEKKIKFEIINSMEKALWESIPCSCKKDLVMKMEKVYKGILPVCEYHRCKIAWESVPKESFTKRGKQINKITLVRGSHEDIQGWII